MSSLDGWRIECEKSLLVCLRGLSKLKNMDRGVPGSSTNCPQWFLESNLESHFYPKHNHWAGLALTNSLQPMWILSINNSCCTYCNTDTETLYHHIFYGCEFGNTTRSMDSDPWYQNSVAQQMFSKSESRFTKRKGLAVFWKEITKCWKLWEARNSIYSI